MKRCMLCLATVAVCFVVGSTLAGEERLPTTDKLVEIVIEVSSTSGSGRVEAAVVKPKGPPPHADGSRNYGRIKRLYPAGDGRLFFRLMGGETKMAPVGGNYYILADHKNYQATVGLLYLAAQNGWTVKARTADQLDAEGYAQVAYIRVDFP